MNPINNSSELELVVMLLESFVFLRKTPVFPYKNAKTLSLFHFVLKYSQALSYPLLTNSPSDICINECVQQLKGLIYRTLNPLCFGLLSI